jgi:hypothetical protein
MASPDWDEAFVAQVLAGLRYSSLRALRLAAEAAAAGPAPDWTRVRGPLAALAWSCDAVLEAALRLALCPAVQDPGGAAAFARAASPPPPRPLAVCLCALVAELLDDDEDGAPPLGPSEWFPLAADFYGLRLAEPAALLERFCREGTAPRWARVRRLVLPDVRLTLDLQARLCARSLVSLSVPAAVRWGAFAALGPALERLSLDGVAVNDDDLRALRLLTRMTHLHLVQCRLQLRYGSLAPVALAPALRSLRLLACTGVLGSAFACRWPQLAELHVTECHTLRSGFFSALGGAPHLRALVLDRCQSLEFAELARLGALCRGLTVLSLNVTLLRAHHLPALFALTALKDVSMGCTSVSLDQAAAALRDHPTLERVRLSSLVTLGGAGLETLRWKPQLATVRRGLGTGQRAATVRARTLAVAPPRARPALAGAFEPVD